MNDGFLRNFFQLFRPKGLLTREAGEPPETFEQLKQRALERERAEEAQRARKTAPTPVDRDVAGLGDNELAAGRAPAVPPRKVNPLAEAVDATPARPDPAERRPQDDDLRTQNAARRPDSRDIRRRNERRAAAR